MKVLWPNYLKLLSYDLSKFFFEELKKLSPPKLNQILGKRRQQKLGFAIIFNPTAQFFLILKNKGARAKLKIWLLIWNQMKVKLQGQNFTILSFALAPLFFKILKNWAVGLKIIASLNFYCLLFPKIWFGLGGDSVFSSWKKTLRGINLKAWNNFDPKPS